jgi:hypothetical protein
MTEDIEGTVAHEGPEPDLAPVVDPLLPVVTDPADQHEVMVRMDEADVQMLLSWAQAGALKKWVYQLPGNKGEGLTIHAVQDIVQRMNWTGRAKIGVLPETLEVESLVADEGGGEERYWVATIFARDELTAQTLPGSSMEPQRMKKRDGTRVFDRFARWKAIQKATRNALGGFIPEEIEQAVIGMATKDPSRVERIRTEAEVKVAELPPPLDDEEARGLIGRAEEVYAEIRELGGGRGKIKMTPGTFNAWKLQAQHSNDVACPACEQPAGRFCKGVRGAHGERVRARLEQIRGAV